MKPIKCAALIVTLPLVLSACTKTPEPESSAPVADKTVTEKPVTPQLNSDTDWLQHGHSADEQRFSPLNQINTDTVGNLELAWYYDLPTKRGQEATPLVVDGVMYTTSAWSHVVALDASTGKQLWHFDPKVPGKTGVKACCDAVNRGVAYDNGKIFLGALDGRLIALDAKTGEQLWSVVTVDQSKPYTITGAPRVVNNKVFIGNGGAEFGVRGYLSAYDTNTGNLVWRFYTVPGGPNDPVGTEPVEAQTATWSGEWWKLGGGGTVWDSMAYDNDTNTLYFGVGNGSPWNPNMRTNGEGDNWFLSSIVAVDADSGTYKWHYQTTPMDAWDYTATQHMILADIEIDGELRKVIMQAPKNGFFYVIDRITGEFISAENFVRTTWAEEIDANGRPVFNTEAQYWLHDKPSLVSPFFLGGHNWHPMSFSPDTGLVYFPAQETAFPYMADNDQTPKKLAANLGIDTSVAEMPDDPNIIAAVKEATSGHLSAWDPVAQKEVWRAQYPGAWNGGVLSTKGGLVFQGSASGFFYAYSATNGEKLWEFPAQTGIVAAPISFEVNGEQYISVSAGWGGIFPLITGDLVADAAGDPVNRSRVLTFKLNGGSALPALTDTPRQLPDYSAQIVDAKRERDGFAIYDRYCGACHGAAAVGGGVVPDLRFSPITASADAWKKVVVDGLLSERGMVAFGDEISPDQAESIRHYILKRNHVARELGTTERLSR